MCYGAINALGFFSTYVIYSSQQEIDPEPVPPCVSLEESVQVYKEHCRMAREFHQVKHEISALEDRKRKLLAELVEDEKVAIEIARLEEEFRRLTEENHTLVTVHGERAQQLKSLCLTNGTRRDSS
ncbi:MAP3K7 C-terminal-like protein TAK1-like protein [Takifugu flavidus]|uniref:MAP3K7 C-terminal-like protein TAK1-like protein n=1 Tax=Takifugu flavidus TaxID=433684 RepID=A0A5C6P8U6_9TELE|nr:MAP3K7 C-terminal-like protein TAK1-like protein [Takifugu flavidus]